MHNKLKIIYNHYNLNTIISVKNLEIYMKTLNLYNKLINWNKTIKMMIFLNLKIKLETIILWIKKII